MLEAPSFTKVKNHLEKKEKAICCILFAPEFSKAGFNEIISRFGYLDSRTGADIHFYCAGYGGYWSKSEVPDMQDIGVGKYEAGTRIPWAFSQQLFAEFVDQMEKETAWTYSGGTEIIVLNSKADFSNCIIFKIDTMLKDEIIMHPGELFEALIRYARSSRNTIERFSLKEVGKKSGEVIIESILSLLPKPLENLWNIWKKGKHYTLVDISK